MARVSQREQVRGEDVMSHQECIMKITKGNHDIKEIPKLSNVSTNKNKLWLSCAKLSTARACYLLAKQLELATH